MADVDLERELRLGCGASVAIGVEKRPKINAFGPGFPLQSGASA